MATTKASLISTINGFITAVIDVTKHRNSMLELINTFFSTTITKSNTAGANQFTYNLKFNKKGNMVHCSGFVKNDYSIIKGNENIFVQTDTELYAKTGQDTTAYGMNSTSLSSQSTMLIFNNANIYLNGAFQVGAIIYINASYQVND